VSPRPARIATVAARPRRNPFRPPEVLARSDAHRRHGGDGTGDDRPAGGPGRPGAHPRCGGPRGAVHRPGGRGALSLRAPRRYGPGPCLGALLGDLPHGPPPPASIMEPAGVGALLARVAALLAPVRADDLERLRAELASATAELERVRDQLHTLANLKHALEA